jgi:release factor glutamine methyltransferase
MRIIEALKTKTFFESTTSSLDLELLLAEAINKERSFLYAHPEYKLTKEQEIIFQKLYKRRLQGEPIAYILGRKEFQSLELMINKHVLIPRPETELLVEVILDRLTCELANVADLGTGSGAIALAIAKERPKWNVVATDISGEALQVAKDNAVRLQVKNIEFYCSDWCRALPNRKLDAIVSNPPYIANSDLHLQTGDVRFEPKVALEAGDGLVAIKTIIHQAKIKLKDSGFLVLEHGYDQSEQVQELLYRSSYREISPYKDLAAIYRVIIAKFVY